MRQKHTATGKLVHTKWGLMLDRHGELLPLNIPTGTKWQDFSYAMETEVEFEIFYRLTFPREPRKSCKAWTVIEAASLKALRIKINITWLAISRQLDIDEFRAKTNKQSFDRPPFKEFELNVQKAHAWIRILKKHNSTL